MNLSIRTSQRLPRLRSATSIRPISLTVNFRSENPTQDLKQASDRIKPSLTLTSIPSTLSLNRLLLASIWSSSSLNRCSYSSSINCLNLKSSSTITQHPVTTFNTKKPPINSFIWLIVFTRLISTSTIVATSVAAVESNPLISAASSDIHNALQLCPKSGPNPSIIDQYYQSSFINNYRLFYDKQSLRANPCPAEPCRIPSSTRPFSTSAEAKKLDLPLSGNVQEKTITHSTKSDSYLMTMEGIKKISAPQPPPRWDHSAQKILALTNDAIKSSRIKLDQIASLKPEDCNFDSVVAPLAENDVIISDIECLTFYQYVSTREDVRNAAVEADKLIQAYDLELTSRLDIYKSILSAKSNIDQSKLDPESKRLIEKLILERKRNGLDLSEGDRKEYNTLKSEINNLAIDFQKNLNEEKGKIWFSLEELRGVPEDVISGFERKEEDQKYGMSFKTPDYSPVIQFAINPETRKRALLGYDSRSIENVPILNKILNLRKRAASVLKKSNWAGHTLEVKMAKEPKTVIQFLRKLREKLEPIGKEEKKKLIELKKNEYKKLGLQGDPEKFYIWDYRYYDRLYTESKLDLSSELVKEYFPVKKVVEAILDIYQELLSVKFIRLLNNKQEAGGEGGVWFKDVIGFEVWNREEYNQNIVKEDNLNSQPAKGFLGYLYLDLEPRDNKYGHAAVWGLIPGYMKADGTRNYPVAAMVANLAKETSTKPALLTHDNVVTFFHEMGHAFHQLCSETRYARFHGTNVARDFVEAPSQMLENWCWTKEQLLKISSHYKNNNEKLPLELIDKLIKSRDVNSGLSNLRQIFFGLFDMYVHTDWKEEEEDNLTKVWCKMRDEVNLFDPSSDLSPGQSTFGHIVGGYDAGYYGYLYSQVFSADMFKTKFEADPMSKSIGKLYREEILRPGGSRDELESLKKFLGREPNDEAFLKRLLGSSNP